MNAYKELEKGIRLVLDNFTSYRVAKDLDITNRTINRYQNGNTPMENMTLKTAKMIYDYYLNNKEEIKMTNRTWERENYEVDMVDHDYDLKKFEIWQYGMVVWTIVPSDVESMREIIEDLDNGEGVEGWEDGLGNTVALINEDTLEAAQDYIRSKYLIDGEDDKYSTLYYDKEEVLEEQDQESFEEQFNVELDELKFPIITFDATGAVDGWLFEETDGVSEVLDRASEYFTNK